MTTTTENLTAPRIALAMIEPDPNNPRKTFDKDELAALASSIKEHGVVTPIKLRPHPTKNHGSFMIVVGERRWRASKLAGVDDIPAVVEELDDKRALEQQIVENTQRADVHPLEEAESFELLIREHGYSVSKLAEKTGRSESHIQSRRRLLKLTPAIKKALRGGKLSPMIAGLAASITIAKMQEEYVQDVLGTWDDKDHGREESVQNLGIMHEDVNPEAKGYGRATRQPLSFRAAQALLHRKFSTRLALAKFSLADALLVPEAGPCTTCPKRSGNQPGLFPDLAEPEDVCTDATCFQKKTTAVWTSSKEEAKARGLEVIEGDDAKGIFQYDGTTTRKAGYVDEAEELPYDLQKSPGSPSKWSKLLGKKLAEVPRVLVQDASGAPRELIDKKKAVELLREMGKIDKPAKVSSSGSGSGSSPTDWAERQRKDEAKRELNRAALSRLLDKMIAGTAEDPGKKEIAIWRWIARNALEEIYHFEVMAERRGIAQKEVVDLVDKAKSVDDVRRLLAEAFACKVGDGATRLYNNKEDMEQLAEACKLFGGDWDTALAAAKEAAKAEAKVEAAKKDAKDEKKKAAKKGAKK